MWDFVNNYLAGIVAQSNLQLSIAVFRELSKNFLSKDYSVPLEKLVRTPMLIHECFGIINPDPCPFGNKH